MSEGYREGRSRQAIRRAFISYVREDSDRVDWLQHKLETAGILVWRDTAELWPGDDWRARIRRAIGDDALVFIACFSKQSLSRSHSYQNEELTLAIEELRRRQPGNPWLIPVRFNDCEIPDLEIGAGRTLRSILWADLFGDRIGEEVSRLIRAIIRIQASTEDVVEGMAPDYITARKSRATRVGLGFLRRKTRLESLEFPGGKARFAALANYEKMAAAAGALQEEAIVGQELTDFSIVEALAEVAPKQAVIDAWGLLEYQLNLASDRIAPDLPHGWPQVVHNLETWDNWPMLYPVVLELRRLRDYTVQSNRSPTTSDAARYVSLAQDLATIFRNLSGRGFGNGE